MMFTKNFHLYEILNPVEYFSLVVMKAIKVSIVNGEKLRETYISPQVSQMYHELGVMAQFVRDTVKSPCIINTWDKDRQYVDLLSYAKRTGDIDLTTTRYLTTQRDSDYKFYQNSGTRDLILCSEGAPLSTHRFKMAEDVKVPVFDLLPRDLRKRKYESTKQRLHRKDKRYRFELNCPWIHIDMLSEGERFF